MNQNKYAQLPNLLKRYRKERGLRQSDVAQLLGIKSKNRISRWERGECLPSLLNAVRLSVIYGVMIDALFIDLLRSVRDEIREREEAYASREKKCIK